MRFISFFISYLTFAAVTATAQTQPANVAQPVNPIFLGEFALPVRDMPLIAGSPDAKNWIIVFSKWNCQICGMMHDSWHQVLTGEPAKNVGVVLMPGVTAHGAEPLMKLMLAAWKEKPQAHDQVATMIWAGAIAPDNIGEIRRNLADFLGGENILIEAEKKHAQWVEQRIELSAKILRKMEEKDGNAGSFPKMLTEKASHVGHLGAPAQYRAFLVERGWASNEWATQQNTGDNKANVNPAQSIIERRNATVPKLFPDIIRLGEITIASGAEGKIWSNSTLLTENASQVNSSNGSVKATILTDEPTLKLKITWTEGLPAGPWNTTLLLQEKSGARHIIRVEGVTKP